MNFYIHQTIHINTLRIDSVANSSVLQIGSAGKISSLSNLYNTGGYTEEAPPATEPLEPQPFPYIPLAETAPTSIFSPNIAPITPLTPVTPR